MSSPDAGDGVGTGALQVDITAAPAGAWTIELTTAQIDVVPGENYPVGFAYRTTNTGSSLAVELEAIWGGGLGPEPVMTLGGAPPVANAWYYAADDQGTFELAPGLFSPYSSTDTLDLTVRISGNGAYVGKVYVDQITVGVPNVHMAQTEGGTATLELSWLRGFLS